MREPPASPPPAVRGRGLRREASILLPVSLLLFAALACVTVLAYRAAIVRLVDERHGIALRQATLVAERASAHARAFDAERLRETLPPGASVTIVDARPPHIVQLLNCCAHLADHDAGPVGISGI